jgi:hypothetical protein
MHQGGLSYETFPVNAAEAETRRHSRFFAFGHTRGSWTVPPETISGESPLTLDLREAAIEVPTVPIVADARTSAQAASSVVHEQGIIEQEPIAR